MHFSLLLLVGFSKFKNPQNPQTLLYFAIDLILRHIEDPTYFWWNKPGRNIQSWLYFYFEKKDQWIGVRIQDSGRWSYKTLDMGLINQYLSYTENESIHHPFYINTIQYMYSIRKYLYGNAALYEDITNKMHKVIENEYRPRRRWCRCRLLDPMQYRYS